MGVRDTTGRAVTFDRPQLVRLSEQRESKKITGIEESRDGV